MSIIDIFYTVCCLRTQTVVPTLPYLQGINRRIQYLTTNPHKPIFHTLN